MYGSFVDTAGASARPFIGSRRCASVRTRRLGARRLHAVVADHRRGEADELLREARVGDDLLVAGHRRREDRLADRKTLGGDGLSPEDGAVLERDEARHAAYTSLPAAIVARTL